jgi:hypothetical protein
MGSTQQRANCRQPSQPKLAPMHIMRQCTSCALDVVSKTQSGCSKRHIANPARRQTHSARLLTTSSQSHPDKCHTQPFPPRQHRKTGDPKRAPPPGPSGTNPITPAALHPHCLFCQPGCVHIHSQLCDFGAAACATLCLCICWALLSQCVAWILLGIPTCTQQATTQQTDPSDRQAQADTTLDNTTRDRAVDMCAALERCTSRNSSCISRRRW